MCRSNKVFIERPSGMVCQFVEGALLGEDTYLKFFKALNATTGWLQLSCKQLQQGRFSYPVGSGDQKFVQRTDRDRDRGEPATDRSVVQSDDRLCRRPSRCLGLACCIQTMKSQRLRRFSNLVLIKSMQSWAGVIE